MSEIIDFESLMRDQMVVTSGRINPSTVRILVGMGFLITKQSAAPAPPNHIYDESSEQEAFEAVNPMPDQVMKFKGGYAPTGYSAWDAQDFCKKWDGWKQCAQSRAKAVEVSP